MRGEISIMALLSYQRIEVNSNLTHFIPSANQEFGCSCSSIDSSSLAFILDGADLPVGFDELLFHKLDSTTLLRSAFPLLIHIHILLNVTVSPHLLSELLWKVEG